MANIILPQVNILSEIDDSTKLMVEQNGEINRYPISDLDIGGGDVTIDLSTGGISSNANPINADTLGGYSAEDYMKINDNLNILEVDLENINEGQINLTNADMLGNHLPEYYATVEDLNNKLSMELLWENSSPTSTFVAQNINVDPTGYDLFLFVVSYNGQMFLSQVIPNEVNKVTQIQYLGNDVQSKFYRGIFIYDGYFYAEDAQKNATVDNTRMIPTHIYGFKGVSA